MSTRNRILASIALVVGILPLSAQASPPSSFAEPTYLTMVTALQLTAEPAVMIDGVKFQGVVQAPSLAEGEATTAHPSNLLLGPPIPVTLDLSFEVAPGLSLTPAAGSDWGLTLDHTF